MGRSLGKAVGVEWDQPEREVLQWRKEKARFPQADEPRRVYHESQR